MRKASRCSAAVRRELGMAIRLATYPVLIDQR